MLVISLLGEEGDQLLTSNESKLECMFSNEAKKLML
jgi:hypothetical protein